MRSLGDGVGADYARRAAGAILDDEVLAHGLVELLHQDARNAIDRSAGRKRHHHGDRAGGIILRRRGGRKRYRERDRKRGSKRKSHGTIPFVQRLSMSRGSCLRRSANFGR